MVKVGLISLGCAKNLIDSEIMAGHLQQEGMTLTNEPDHADVLIVNTCSFIDMAKRESIGAIQDAVEGRQENPVRKRQKSTKRQSNKRVYCYGIVFRNCAF